MSETAHDASHAATTVEITRSEAYDQVAIVTEAYEKYALPVTKEKVPLKEMLSNELKAVRIHGHMDESEFRRFIRGSIAGTNAAVLSDMAREQSQKAAHIVNGLIAELVERFPDILKERALLDTATGAIFTPAPRITPPARPIDPKANGVPSN